MKKLQKIFSTVPGRTLGYLSVFILGSALIEIIVKIIINPIPLSNISIVLTLLTIFAFTATGFLYANEGHARSRITSGATLFFLSFIALRFGNSVISDSFLLVLALLASVIGAEKILHVKQNTSKQNTIMGTLTIVMAFLAALIFVVALRMLDVSTIT